MTDIIQTMDKINGLAALLYTESQEPRMFEKDNLCGVSELHGVLPGTFS